MSQPATCATPQPSRVEHLTGTARRHPAAQVDYTPSGFVAATNVQGAITELVTALSSAATGTPGASKVGADAVPGTPNALPAGNVDGQLAQLLAWLNSHVGAAASAHAASAIAAAAHNYLTSTSVQAQLQEIVSALSATSAGASGASRIGSESIANGARVLDAGTVRAQLTALLGMVGSADSASAASVSVADEGNNLNAGDVEGALAELADVFEIDHSRVNEPNPGYHRTIHQPAMSGTRVLLWDAAGTGAPSAHLRIYLDADAFWITMNAAWDSSLGWVKDSTSYAAAAISFSRSAFALQVDDTPNVAFWTWTRSWKVDLTSAAATAAIQTEGHLKECGRCGAAMINPSGSSAYLVGGNCVTFRTRFPWSPSSITLTALETSPTTPQVALMSFSREGFAFWIQGTAASGQVLHWFGEYSAIN